jgi:phage terminase large subunit
MPIKLLPKASRPKSRSDPGRLKGEQEKLARAIATPSGFAKIVLDFDLYPKQADAIDALTEPGSAVSIAAANGAGKTSRLLNAIVLWHATLFPAGKIKCVSASWPQVEDQVWPNIKRFKEKFPGWKWLETPFFESVCPQTRDRGFFRAFSTNDPGKAEGDHEDGPDKPLLYIVDEAKSCPVWLRGVIEGRVRPTRLLLMSSHGFSEGWFYDTHTIHKHLYKTFTISVDDLPHIPQKEIDEVREKWSGNPAFADSVLGYGFIPLTEDAVINAMALQQVLASPPERKPGERHAFCDFAWSNDGDENVLAVRDGNDVQLAECFHADSLHSVCDRFVAAFNRLGLTSGEISGDEGGGGKLIMDELDRRGWTLNRVNNGSPASDDAHYANVAAEMWYEGSKLITLKQIRLPDDRDLRGQLISRKRIKGSKDRLAVESKRDMKKRGVMSPDRADAILGCLMPIGGITCSTVTYAKPIAVGNYLKFRPSTA